MKVGIIDLDPIIHIVANVQYSSGNRDNEEKVKRQVRSFILQVQASAKCTHYVMFYQGSGFKNFRKDILPEYKAHRTPSDGILLWKAAILDELNNFGGATRLFFIESDDALSLYAEMCRNKEIEYVVITGDKDSIQIPGTQYNPYKAGTMEEDRWKYVTFGYANQFLHCQYLAGDSDDISTDFAGIRGVGIRTAQRYLNKFPMQKWQEAITQFYVDKLGDDARTRFLNTYKMVKLLDESIIAKYGDDVEKECKSVISLDPKSYINQTTQLFDDLFNT